jgi:hypothetical protein
MTKPCLIPNCPALRVIGRWYCAIHEAMGPQERRAAELDAKARAEPPQLRPVTTRIEYE